jgi:hypothetical protein
MGIRRGHLYVFRKSGNLVRAIEPTSYGGHGNWTVQRVDGASAGKELIVPGRALLSPRSVGLAVPAALCN